MVYNAMCQKCLKIYAPPISKLVFGHLARQNEIKLKKQINIKSEMTFAFRAHGITNCRW